MDSSRAWRKSSYTQNGGDCVEIAEAPNSVQLRDSKHPHLDYLDLPTREWAALVHAVRHDEV